MTMRVLLAGASGYIGQAVLAELIRRKLDVVALARPNTPLAAIPGPSMEVVSYDWAVSPTSTPLVGDVDVVVSCIASRSGTPSDAYRVDYLANQALLKMAKNANARHFVLLSAICVQKPRLAFQFEKLRFETALAASGMASTVVRPTAFFKSLSGQIDRIRQGKPFLRFGDGTLTACKPISESDLALFLVDQLDWSGPGQRVLPIGGPGPAMTPLDQAAALYRVFGGREKHRSVSPALFDVLAAVMGSVAGISSWAGDRREFLRIAKYYATESMLVWDEDRQAYDDSLTPETGSDTLEAFYTRVRGGSAELARQRGATLFS